MLQECYTQMKALIRQRDDEASGKVKGALAQTRKDCDKAYNAVLDIITFDYDEDDVINGDLVISLDTVKSNAELFHKEYDEELHRVIIHGILHLCGLNDKGSGEREQMEAAENRALALR